MGDVVYPYGVGGIADIAGESFVAMDTGWWPSESRKLECRRLEDALGAGLKSPPSVPDRPHRDTPALMFMRFPEWRFCQNCRRVSKLLKRDGGVLKNQCLNCAGPMVPMRFIAVCSDHSHAQDVPWWWWTHSGSDKEEHRRCQDRALLEFVTSDDAGEGLAGLRTICRACGASRPLNELTANSALGRVGLRCGGRQPWQHEDQRQECDSELQVVQRGSSSVHIADTVSALDIPDAPSPSSVAAGRVREHSGFKNLEAAPDAPGAELRAQMIADDSGVGVDLVLSLARSGIAPLADLRAGLRDGEWAAFLTSLDGRDETKASDFVVRESPADLSQGEHWDLLRSAVARVGGVQRIREVRALTGFRRYSLQADLVRVDLGRSGGVPQWYPAVEQFGEGIFIQFEEQSLREWEQHLAVADRIAPLEDRRERATIADRLQRPHARFVLLHTLAHLLIRRLAFESGYTAASLRERIYADPDGADPQAGILIYTASGDSEGTLGGLVRQARGERIAELLLKAIEDGDRCSNDPLCMESTGQGMNALNLAACHGCCLVSETSCENLNVLLDRGMVVGAGSAPGYFAPILQSARQAIEVR